MDNVKVTIEGSLGSGNTTLLQSLAQQGYKVRLENVAEWTDLLKKYYTALGRQDAWIPGTRLQTRITLDSCTADQNVDFEERCAHTQPSTFMQHMLQTGGLQPGGYDMLTELVRRLSTRPECIIYLKCDPEVALRRVRERDRECEGQVTIEYMRDMYAIYQAAASLWRQEGLRVYEFDVSHMAPEAVLQRVLWIRQIVTSATNA